eukprot:g710.t1
MPVLEDAANLLISLLHSSSCCDLDKVMFGKQVKTAVLFADSFAPGVRVQLGPQCTVNGVEVGPVQIDISSGDPLHPFPSWIPYKAILDSLPARSSEMMVHACSFESMFAWKLHGLFENNPPDTARGYANGLVQGRWRSKDLADLFRISQAGVIRTKRCDRPADAVLATAIATAFASRASPLELVFKFAAGKFGRGSSSRRNWRRYLRDLDDRARAGLPTELRDVVEAIALVLRETVIASGLMPRADGEGLAGEGVARDDEDKGKDEDEGEGEGEAKRDGDRDGDDVLVGPRDAQERAVFARAESEEVHRIVKRDHENHAGPVSAAAAKGGLPGLFGSDAASSSLVYATSSLTKFREVTRVLAEFQSCLEWSAIKPPLTLCKGGPVELAELQARYVWGVLKKPVILDVTFLTVQHGSGGSEHGSGGSSDIRVGGSRSSTFFYVDNDEEFAKCFGGHAATVGTVLAYTQDGKQLAQHLREKEYSRLFEIHCTVKNDDQSKELLDRFVSLCDRLKVKAVVIENAGGAVPVQVMTASHHVGTFAQVHLEAFRLSQALAKEGFLVARTKVEAAFSNAGVPITDEEARALSPENYFEFHIKCCDALEDAGFEIAAKIREYAIFDSNVKLDRGWIESGNGDTGTAGPAGESKRSACTTTTPSPAAWHKQISN